MKLKILFILFMLLNLKVHSQIPQLISYQGVLTDNAGNLVSNGNYNVTFNLYTVSTAGASIWNETQTVTTNVGVFNVNLGSVTPFTIGFSSQYYLGVTISGVEMSPRTQLTSAAYAINGVPSGTILNYGGNSIPSGYLLCDGSAVSRTTYASLFTSIGTAFGIGNGTTTFNLPDLRGRFVRGVDGAANRDPDKASRIATNSGNTANNVGSVQEDAFQGHRHFIWSPNLNRNVTSWGSSIGGAYSTGWYLMDPTNSGHNPDTETSTSDFYITDARSDGTNGTPRTSSESRPDNIYLFYIIKF